MFAPRYNDSSLEERFLIRDILVHLSQPASVFKRILFALRTYETPREISPSFVLLHGNGILLNLLFCALLRNVL